MNKENKLIPELRFPEFENKEEWESENLGVICDVRDGTHDSPKYVSEGYPLITSKNLLIDGTMDFTNVNYLKRHDYIQINKRSKVDIGDILFGMIGTIGNPVIVKKDGFAIKNVALIKSKGQINQDFLLHQLKSDFIGKQFDRVNAGGILKFIALGIIRDLNALVPNPKEQKKIASCLSSLDEVIAANSQKLELLKDHKKGLMQNLFPQEGEKVPKYRFKEFVNDGEWVFEAFEKAYSFLVTNSFSREYLNYENGTVKNIHYGDIHTKFSTLFDINKETVPFINPAITIERIREECYCLEGDMIFADASEDLNDVGKSIEIINLKNEKLLSGLHTLLARQIETKLVIGFGGYLFLSNRIRTQIQKEAQGAKVKGISGTRISNIEIFYPKETKEQQKIASCLSSLDELISIQAEKIEQLKLHKKGLMQGLFPKMND